MLNVGVLFRNNEELVAPFFFFLRKGAGIPIKVFALNNGSEDNTETELTKVLLPDDVYIKMPANVGISQGRNQIIKRIKKETGEYQDLCLLDSDLFIARKNSLKIMYEALHKNNCVISFGYTYSHNDGNRQTTGICFSIIGTRCFIEIGLFDEKFWCWYDDVDFMRKLKLLKKVHANCENAIAIHLWGATLSAGSEGYRRIEMIEKDKQTFNRKWGINKSRIE